MLHLIVRFVPLGISVDEEKRETKNSNRRWKRERKMRESRREIPKLSKGFAYTSFLIYLFIYLFLSRLPLNLINWQEISSDMDVVHENADRTFCGSPFWKGR